MVRVRTSIIGVAGVLCGLLLVPAVAFGQGAIAGVVRDASGGVLPGVTVEASSPALIEKVRSVLTDAQGVYKIVDLRPGDYVVTFTLAGFSPLKREGISLAGSFTATVNVELRLGELSETITVSGLSAMVDVQGNKVEKVIARDVIDSLPTGARDPKQLASLVPGIVANNNNNVGGVALVSDQITIHNSRPLETQLILDGIPYNHGGGVGGNRAGILLNDGAVEEVGLQITTSASAESAYGALITSIVPKEGGNTFRGLFIGAFANSNMQANNISAAQDAAGIKANGLKQTWDANVAFGGAIKRDKLWYFSAFRSWGIDQYVTGTYFNSTPDSYKLTPDPSRPAIAPVHLADANTRLTWQVNSQNKIGAYYNWAYHCECYSYKLGTSTSATVPPSPEAASYYNWRPDYMASLKWTSTMSSRLLVEAGGTYVNFNNPTYPQLGQDRSLPGITEQTTGVKFQNITGLEGSQHTKNLNLILKANYVTGAHAAKFGVTLSHASAHSQQDSTGGGISYTVRNGVPISFTMVANPLDLKEVLKANLGIFAQDQWTLNRLTINAGLRYDWWNAYVPAAHAGPGPLVPNRNVDYPQVNNVPNWKDVSTRLGVSYDLFGNGKTAVKATLGKFLIGTEILSFTRAAEPQAATVTSSTRTITDGSFVLKCDLTNPAANGNCGVGNANFGNTRILTRYDPEVTTANRGNNWETSASIQHELMTGVVLNGGYYRRWYNNLNFTENLATPATAYDPYCVPVPSDALLPNSGQQLCGFYDVTPALVGQTDNLIQLAPEMTEIFNGVDFNVSARVSHGVIISGGTSTGRVTKDNCFAKSYPNYLVAGSAANVQVPRTDDYCNVAPPFQTQYKAYVIYPLPYGIQTSASFKSIPGPQLAATYAATNAQIVPTLGRNLSAGANATVTVDLIAPGTMYGDRLNQVDWRISKTFPMGSRRLRMNFDIYNVMNRNTTLGYNNTYGPNWLKPNLILSGRLMKIGGQFDF